MDVGTRIESLCTLNGVSLRELCAKSEINYTTLHQQIRKKRDIPFASIEKISRAFDTDIRFFSNRSSLLISRDEGFEERASDHSHKVRVAQNQLLVRGRQLAPETIISWLRAEEGKLTSFDSIKDHFDLFHPVEPTDQFLKPARIGSHSLAAKWFRIRSNAEYIERVGRFPDAVKTSVVESHIALARSGRYRMEDVSLSVDTADVTLSKEYCRIMAPVYDDDGNRFTMVFAQLL